MSAFLPFDQSRSEVFVTQGIGDADPSHDGCLYKSWDLGVPFGAQALTATSGEALEKIQRQRRS